MKELKIRVVNRLGLHARAASRFVHLANEYKSRIFVSKEGSRVDGKSILGLLTLAAGKGSMLLLTAEGEDEGEALAALAALVKQRFGESE